MLHAVGKGDGQTSHLMNDLGLDKELAKSVNFCPALSGLHASLIFSGGIKYMGLMAIICLRDFRTVWVVAASLRVEDGRSQAIG